MKFGGFVRQTGGFREDCNGAVGSYSTLVAISSAYFVHKTTQESTFKLITAVLLSLNFKYFNGKL